MILQEWIPANRKRLPAKLSFVEPLQVINLSELINQEESEARQRSRFNWLTLGDANMSF